MRKLIYAINLTADGCCDHMKVPPPVGDGMLDQHYTQLLQGCDTAVYGRVTYELMVPYWPDVAKDPNEDPASIAFAQAFERLSRVVFSRTLADPNDGKTRVVRGNLPEEVLKLKQGDGKDILVGGVDIPAQLTELSLIDEYQVLVQPAIVGAGRRLFDGANLAARLPLRLVDTKQFKSGSMWLRYVKRDAA